MRALAGGSKTLAAAEYSQISRCSDADAAAWIAHLLDCPEAWPVTSADKHILDGIDCVFADVAKPERFTDRAHCRECADHDDTLSARTTRTLRRSDLGTSGWDPIAFAGADGIGYLFPALARFALCPDVWREHDWYGALLVNHLGRDGRENRFLAWCSPARRAAVHALLLHLAQTRTETISLHGCGDDLQAALTVWAPADASVSANG